MSETFPVIEIRQVAGSYQSTFRIGAQTFYVGTPSTKADAEWYCDMLRKAFNRYETAIKNNNNG